MRFEACPGLRRVSSSLIISLSQISGEMQNTDTWQDEPFFFGNEADQTVNSYEIACLPTAVSR